MDGNIKLILGLFSELFYHYHIKVTTPEMAVSTSNRVALLEWFQAILPGSHITNLTTSWNNGLALAALVDYCKPSLIPDHASLDPNNRLENIRNIMDVAEMELGIPKVVSPEDLASEKPDELLTMMYLSYFCNPQSIGQRTLLEWANTFLPSKKITNFGSCWKDGRILYELVQSILPRAMSPLDMLHDQSPSELIHLAREAAETELDITAPRGLKASTAAITAEGDFQLALIVFLAQLQSKVKSPIPPDSLSAVGTGITGTNVDEEALITILGDIPSSDNLTVIVTEPSSLQLYVDESSPTSFKYTPTEHGEHTVDITFYGQPIAGSPYRVLHVDKTLVTECSVSGQFYRACVDKQASFNVDCSKAGAGEVTVFIETMQGDQIPVLVTRKPGCQHEVVFTPVSIGELTLHISWNGESVPGSPFKCQVIDPSRCEAGGVGLSNSILGRPAQFNISTCEAGEGSPSATVSGPSEPVDLVLISAKDGMYTYEYTPVQKGSYHIDIKFSGFSIHGSPFIVRPQTPTIASGCSVKDFPRTSMPTNEPISILVTVDEVDDRTNLVGTFILEESDEDEAQCDVAPIRGEDNLYEVSFIPKEVGVYTVHVQYGGLEIPECPLNFAVNDPSKCAVDFDSSKLYHIDEAVAFHVETDTAGYGVLTASGKDPSGDKFKLKVIEDGEGLNTYIASFVPKQGGKYYITLLFDNRPLSDMPLCVHVESNTLDNIVLSKPVSQHGYILIDEAVNFKMFAPDRSESSFAVTSLGVNTGAIPRVDIEPLGEDSFNITFKASHPDEYKVQIMYSGRQIPGSPFTVNVNQSPRPEQVVAFDHVIPFKSRKPIELTFDASLGGGAGSGTLTANISSTSKKWIIPTVNEISPGLFTVSFVPPCEDTYSVTVYWYGKQVKDSPFVIEYKQPTHPPKVAVEFEPDQSDTGRQLLMATAIGQNTKTKAKVDVQQYERGKYQISLSPAQEDVYKLHVFWFNSEIKGSPFTVDLTGTKQAPSPSRNVQEISALVVGEKSGPRRATMTLNKKKDVASISFEDRRRDKYDLFVYLNKLLVKGAPFKIDVSS